MFAGLPEGSVVAREQEGARGMTLSFFYHKQARRMERIYRKRAKAVGEYEVRETLRLRGPIKCKNIQVPSTLHATSEATR